MTLYRIDVPVAHSMVHLANRVRRESDAPFQRFLCYWVAFNNVYTVLAERDGLLPELCSDKAGGLKTQDIAGRRVPKVRTPRERDQIDIAKLKMSADLKRGLIWHPSAEFFVERVPRWQGSPLTHDAQGQCLNGVLNVGYTVSSEYPVWSPIDSEKFYRVKAGSEELGELDDLASQLVDVLYTVRNNLVHGGKRADDSSDSEVVEKALPLLQMIVDYFLRGNQRQRRSTLSERGQIS